MRCAVCFGPADFFRRCERGCNFEVARCSRCVLRAFPEQWSVMTLEARDHEAACIYVAPAPARPRSAASAARDEVLRRVAAIEEVLPLKLRARLRKLLGDAS